MIQRLPVLLCPHCYGQTVLPYRNLRGTSDLEPYWPTDGETITLACQCGHSSVHWKREIHKESVQSEDPNQPPSVLWRVEFSCSHAGCGLPIVVHTRTEDETAPETIAGRAYNVTPKPQCPAGHAEGAKVESIERIEWTERMDI
jgi:hypothetical protein